MRARSRLRISPRTGASERREVAPGAGKGLKNRRAKAVSAQRLSADGPEHQTEAAERSVRGFMRSRSRPQRPRTGKRSLPGPGKGAVPNAGGAGRSPRSGRPARPGGREGAPTGRTGAGSQTAGRAERSPALTDDGDRRESRGERRDRRCTKPEGSDAAARPRRLERWPPTKQIFGTNTQNESSRLPTKHAAGKRKHRARKARAVPSPGAEERAGDALARVRKGKMQAA